MQPDKQSFMSRNKICLLVNDIKRIGHNMQALLTRGFYIDFCPSNQEIMNKLKEFATDTEIISFIEANKNQIRDFNLRVYTRSIELKNAGIDWKNWILKEFCIGKEEMILQQIKDLPAKERNEIWEAETGKSIRSLQRRIKNKVTNDK